MQKLLACSACGAALSVPLVVRSGKDPAVAKPALKDREPAVPTGAAFKSYEPVERSYSDVPAPLEFTPQHWINPADLTPAVRDTKRVDRLGGCCGIAGTSGPNKVCACGAEIGTLRDDCFTPRIFIPEPATTRWEPVPYT